MKMRRTVLALCAGLAIAGSAMGAPRNLTSAEKTKVFEMLDLMEEMARKGGYLNNSLSSTFNMMGDPGDEPVQYEPANKTYKDAINELRKMLDQNRIRVDPAVGWGASTSVRSGTGNDTIQISADLLKFVCGTSNAPAIEGIEPDARKFWAKFQLATSLSNELVHVFQIFRGRDAEQCDAERDSDTASLLFICEVLDSLNAAPTLADVNADNCPKLVKCLMRSGINTAEEFKDAKAEAKRIKDRYVNRRRDVFDANLNRETSWGRDYYGRGYSWPLTFPDQRSPGAVGLAKPDGTRRVYELPDGKTYVNHTLTRNAERKYVLTIVAQAADGSTCLFTYVDSDCDGLPDADPSVTRIPLITLPRLRFEIAIFGGLPGDLIEAPTGLAIHDKALGQLLFVPVDPATGIPSEDGIVSQLDELLSNFEHPLPEFQEIEPGLFAFGFTQDVPLETQPGTDALMFLFEQETGAIQPLGIVPVGQEFDQPVGGVGIEVGSTQVELFAKRNGLFLDLIDIGNEFPQPLVGGQTDPRTGSLVLPLPEPLGPGLFEVHDETGCRTSYFLPPLGENIGCVVGDEGGPTGGDDAPDRWHISTNPPRIWFFPGSVEAPGEAWLPPVEQVLPLPDLTGFGLWPFTDRPRELTVMSQVDPVPVEIIALGLEGVEPIVVTQQGDADGDGANNDTLILRKRPGRTKFSVDSFFDISFDIRVGPSTELPDGVVPEVASLQDINGDGIADMRVLAISGEELCLINDGTGAMVLGPCENPCLADVNMDGVLNGADFNAWLAAFSAGSPSADQNQDGVLNGADFNAWLANFAAGCD